METNETSTERRVQQARRLRQRFQIIPFQNSGGSESWRVSGITRAGSRIRENYSDPEEARIRHIALEAEYHGNDATERASLRATRLTDEAIRIAENSFARLDKAEDMISAVDLWLKSGRDQYVKTSPRLDAAAEAFFQHLDAAAHIYRPRTIGNLKNRVSMFVNATPNMRVGDVSRDHVFSFLKGRTVDPSARDNDRRALSRFFSWCKFGEREWIKSNPCALGRNEKKEFPFLYATGNGAPAILTIEQCERLMRIAERYRGGLLAPYCAITLFAGLRPSEAAELTWEDINLTRRSITVRSRKVKATRIVRMDPACHAWLTQFKDQPIYPANWRKRFKVLQAALGFGTPTTRRPDLKDWPEDVLRHTAASYMIARTGSYAESADNLGNSESVLRKHYRAHVERADTKRFYAIKPTTKGTK